MFSEVGRGLGLFGYESLAELIEQGRVSAKDPVRGVVLSKDDVLEYGRRYAEEMKESGGILVTPPYFEELNLSLGNDRVIVGDADVEKFIEQDDIWLEFLTQFDPLVDRRMREAGWHDSVNTDEDFRIYLDEERHIIVEDQTGKRLTPGDKREASR